MPYMSASSWFGIGKETTRGTGVTPTYYIPIQEPQWSTDVKWLEDKGLRGSPVDIYSHQAGVRVDMYEFKGAVFLDSLPVWLMSILGGADAVTGAGPYSHVIGMANAIATGSQPPSYTLADFDAGAAGTTSMRQLAAGQMAQLDLSFASDAMLGISGKYLTNPQAVVSASTPTSPETTEILVPAWNCAVTFAGSTSTIIEEGALSLKRGTEAFWTLGAQNPYRIWAGPLVVDGKVTAVYENNSDPLTGATVITDATTRPSSPPVLKFTFTEPVSGHFSTLQMSQVQLMNPKPLRGKKYVEIEFDFSAEANTTDKVSTGYAPITSTTSNAISVTY